MLASLLRGKLVTTCVCLSSSISSFIAAAVTAESGDGADNRLLPPDTSCHWSRCCCWEQQTAAYDTGGWVGGGLLTSSCSSRPLQPSTARA